MEITFNARELNFSGLSWLKREEIHQHLEVIMFSRKQNRQHRKYSWRITLRFCQQEALEKNLKAAEKNKNYLMVISLPLPFYHSAIHACMNRQVTLGIHKEQNSRAEAYIRNHSDKTMMLIKRIFDKCVHSCKKYLALLKTYCGTYIYTMSSYKGKNI